MAAAVAGLAPGSPAPVQIGACRALAQASVATTCCRRWQEQSVSCSAVLMSVLCLLRHNVCLFGCRCPRLQLCQKAKPEELAGVAQDMFAGLVQLLRSSAGARTWGCAHTGTHDTLLAARLELPPGCT